MNPELTARWFNVFINDKAEISVATEKYEWRAWAP